MKKRAQRERRRIRYRYRSAITGRFVRAAWAERHRGITVRERIRPRKAANGGESHAV